MTPKQFSNLMVVRDYDKVQKALDKGYDANTPVNEYGMTPLESSSHSDDYKMMYLLWKAGAKPTTHMTKEIVKKFKAGQTPESFEEEDTLDTENLTDLTDAFTVNKLEFEEGEMVSEGKDKYSIRIPLVPFLYDGEAVITALDLPGVKLRGELKKLIGSTITFPVNPEKGYIDGSVYMWDSHVPVDVTAIKINRISRKKIHLELTAAFVFEHEATGFENEKRKIEVVVVLKDK